MVKKILIIADIEGSTGCANYEASSFNTSQWYNACIDMSLDINAVVLKLFEAGVQKIYVKDFHRTGYNLLPELIDHRAIIIHGYKQGPIPGIGNAYDAEVVMFIGMHASSGSNGFLAHTLTSKYNYISVNGKNISELQLFASSLYSNSIKPVFFSGCPIACSEAEEQVPGVKTFQVLKNEKGEINKILCRENIALAAVESLFNIVVNPYIMKAPFDTKLSIREGETKALAISKRWKLVNKGNIIYFTAIDFDDFYKKLLGVTYFTPIFEKVIVIALFLFNLYGKIGLFFVRFNKRTQIKNLK